MSGTRSVSPLSPVWKLTKGTRSSSFLPFFVWKIPSDVTNGVSTAREKNSPTSELVFTQGPSCIYVGPIETASKELLEALYRQARDAYYSGEPLIVDDMFDKIELKLRSYGSKSVVKYPRCSLRRQSTYADAEEDTSQVLALASVWAFLLMFGGFSLLLPAIYTIGLTYHDSFSSRLSTNRVASSLEFLTTLNGILFMGLGSLIGYPVALASVQALQGLWRNDLVALKGSCPNCGEEVFAFVQAGESQQSPHRADCHVCDCTIEFRTKSVSRSGRRWIYGRIYLIPGTARTWRRSK